MKRLSGTDALHLDRAVWIEHKDVDVDKPPVHDPFDR